jgi:uncharacterized cupin superfamily protein
MRPPVVNIDDVPYGPATSHGDKFACVMADVGVKLGSKRLGYNVTKVAPGKSAFPFHSHHNNEEMFFVLSGSGTLRFGAERHALRRGDFVACPQGGAEVAHQITNTGDVDLVYLAVSTLSDIDVMSYPDSGKFGVVAGIEPGSASPPKATFPHKFHVEAAAVDYWQGE